MANDPKKVVIEFENAEAALHFAHWLCGGGEQDYWNWMRFRESEQENKTGDITALQFDYFELNGGEFGTHISTECGRQDAEPGYEGP